MKNGDNVYCIKSIGTKHKYIFEKGRIYTIRNMYEDSNRIYVQHIGIDGKQYVSAFCINDDPIFLHSNIGWHIFSKYFITEKEIRRLKIKKLNG